MPEPTKLPGCKHQFAEVPSCAPAFLNKYHCGNCGTSWEDVWSCGCDYECPNCGLDIEVCSSHEIAPCACRYLGE